MTSIMNFMNTVLKIKVVAPTETLIDDTHNNKVLCSATKFESTWQ